LMYAKASGIGAATLPFTGGPDMMLFVLIAGFTLIMAGCALLRLLPREEG
jgi:hypothetical protein